MALNLDFGSDNFEVISSKDSSIGASPEKYSEYLSTLNESLLELKPGSEPTRFIMRKILPYGVQQRLRNEQTTIKHTGEASIHIGFIMEEVRASLVDIKNPGSSMLVYKRDSDGLASKELVSLLEAAGIAGELYKARQTALSDTAPAKKS